MAYEYEKIVLDAGVWNHNGPDYVDNVVFTGYKVSSATAFMYGLNKSNGRGTVWELYKIEGGKYLLWWKQRMQSTHGFDVADCAVIDALPKPGDVYKGIIMGLPSEPFLEELAEWYAEEVWAECTRLAGRP